MIKEALKDFLNPDNTKNYIVGKYISFFSYLWLKIILKKIKISKSDLINFYISRQYMSLKPFQIKYLFHIILYWNNFINFTIEKIIIKLIYKVYLKTKGKNQKSNFQIFKKQINEDFFQTVSFINEINKLYLIFSVKNKKLNRYLSQLKNISDLLKLKNLDRRHKNNLIDDIANLNKKHQKLFYSSKFDNVIMYYQKLLLKLDNYIFDDKNIFMLSDVNYGYLNTYLKDIKYNFKSKSNIYKSQIFETCMLLNNFSRLMDKYGFKTTINYVKNITIENTKYILDEH